MKYILLIVSILLSNLTGSSAAAAAPPAMVISHNAIVGEYPCNPLDCYVRPKKQINLLLYPIEQSEIVTSLDAGESAKVIQYEVHSVPANAKILISSSIPSYGNTSIQELNKGKNLPYPGEYAYILFYAGEGLLYAWYNNSIIMIPSSGISGLPIGGNSNYIWAKFLGPGNISEDIWFCLRKDNGQEGWIKFTYRNNRDEYYSKYKGWGIFLDKP